MIRLWSLGRWDQKRPTFGFDLDKAGFILMGIGIGLTVLAVGSNVIGSNLGFKQYVSGSYIIPGLAVQITFIVGGIIVTIVGILLLFINSGHVKTKRLDYGDDKFGQDWE